MNARTEYANEKISYAKPPLHVKGPHKWSTTLFDYIQLKKPIKRKNMALKENILHFKFKDKEVIL